MCFLFFLVGFLGLFGGIFGSIFIFSHWATHREMTTHNCEYWNYANFPTFLREFSSRKWQYKKEWRYSFFSEKGDRNDHIHADIIKFDGKGMVLYPWSFLRFMVWRKDYVKDMGAFGRDRELWT